MDQTLQAALVAIITKVTAGVETSIQFLSNQLPDVIHQLLMWKLLEHFVPMLVTTLFVVICAIVAKQTFKLCYEKSRERDYNHPNYLTSKPVYIDEENLDMDRVLIWSFANGIPSAIAVMSWTFSMNLVWLQILVAPKIYLIEYATKLLK